MLVIAEMLRGFKNFLCRDRASDDAAFYEVSESCQVPDLARTWAFLFGKRDNGYFVEVGAHDGDYCSNTSCLADAGWSGLYIEPIIEHYELCKRRHAKNAGVRTINCAASDRSGTATIFVGGLLSTLSSELVEDYRLIDWAEGNHVGEAREIVTERLDTLLNREGVPRGFDVLVVDVEGAEKQVMDGFALADWRPKAIMIELEDEHPDFKDNERVVQAAAAVRRMLEYADYSVYFKDAINTLYVRRDWMEHRRRAISRR